MNRHSISNGARNRHKASQPSKLVWTRHGWLRVEASPEDVKAWHITKTKTPPEHVAGDRRSYTPELMLLQEANDEIIYGDARTKTDELPQSLKFVLGDPDKWFINRSNSALFAVVDPITQVYEYNEWGSDRSEADIETFNERPSASRLYLEALGIVLPETESERVSDILGAIAYDSKGQDHNVYHSPFATRVETDVSAVASGSENPVLGDEYTDDDTETAFQQSDDEVVMRYDPRTTATVLPELDDETKAAIRTITDTFRELISKATTDQEQTLLTLQYEQALDREVGRNITTCINSPYCGYGYSQPRRIHKGIRLPEVFNTEVAAENRVEFFYQLLGEAASCDSERDLYGPWITDPMTGQRSRSGGFLGKIRGMYHSDKVLWANWSINDHIDRKTGDVIHRSALSIAREEFIREWRENKKGDEEQLRIAVWVWFDRRKKVNLGERNNNGQVVSHFSSHKDSIWLQRRAQAFTEEFLTKKQWDSIYKMVDIIKARLKLNRESSEERRKVLDLLAKHFSRIDNLYDLKAYMAWAQHRKWKREARLYDPPRYTMHKDGGFFRDKSGELVPKWRFVKTFDFHPSLIDRISITDEARWSKSCARLRRHLLGREVLYEQLREQVTSSRETNIEASLPCTHVKCLSADEAKRVPALHVQAIPAQAIGKLKWYEITQSGSNQSGAHIPGKGLLGLECEQCGRIIWQLGHTEIPTLRTYEEATNGD
jgi:hypothetical protein